VGDFESRTPIYSLDDDQREERVMGLWAIGVRKVKIMNTINKAFLGVHRDIKWFGASKNILMSSQQTQESDSAPYICRFVISPDNRLFRVWILFIVLAQMVGAALYPFYAAFLKMEEPTPATAMGILIVLDLIYIVDSVFPFFLSYVDAEHNEEVRFRYILKRHLRSYFVFDLVSGMPISLLQLYERAKSPKDLVYTDYAVRYFYFLKLLKTFAMFKYREPLGHMSSRLKISTAFSRLFVVSVGVFFAAHASACMFFLNALVDGLNYNTWVVVHDLRDADPFLQYLNALYWAFQVLTTVGFGDISLLTRLEKLFSIFWMVFGVGFYSFTIGNLSSIMSSLDVREARLKAKLEALKEFCEKASLSKHVEVRIRRFLENNNSEINIID